MSDHVTLWRCPACGAVALDTGQKARYCGATKACVKKAGRHIFESMAMERVKYAPVDSAGPDATEESGA